jgi:hypothetical protein
MPADGIPRGPSASNGDVGTSRLEAQLLRRLHDPTPIQKRPHIGRGAAQNNAAQTIPAKTSDPDVRVGSKGDLRARLI